MATSRQFMIICLLLCSGLVYSTNTTQSETSDINYTINPIINSNYFDEGISVYVGNEGYIWANYWISSSVVSFDSIELESLIPSQYRNILESISIQFYPDEYSNVFLKLYIRSSNHAQAEEYANLFVEAITSGTLFEFTHQTSSYYDYWADNEMRIGTVLEFSATIDINHLVPYLVDTVSDHELISQFDYDKLHEIQLNIWNWDSDFTGSLNFYFDAEFPTPDGGHTLSLNNLTGITTFKSSFGTESFVIEVNLPQATNPSFVGISNGENIQITWETYPDGYVKGILGLLNGASLDEIEITFDYSFQLWHWLNKESIFWEVDQRGFEKYYIDINGKHRIIPHPDLAYNSSLMTNVAELNLQLSSEWNTGYFQVAFLGTDMRDTEYSQIEAILTSIGLGMYNGTVNNNTYNWYRWENDQQIQYQVRNYWIYFDIFPENFTSVVSSFQANSNSALLNSADLSKFDDFSFSLYSDKWGLYPSISLGYDYKDQKLHPIGQTPDFVNGSQIVDLFNLPFLNLVDDFPWNSYSEELIFYFISPYDGNEETIAVNPESNWGLNWWSGLWFDQHDFPHLEYHINIKGDDIQTFNQQGDPSGIAPEFVLTFDSEYISIDSDLEAPYVKDIAWRDHSQPDQGYHDYTSYPRDFSGTFSGNLDLMAVVQDYGAEGWWYNMTSDQYEELYPSSGIADVSGFLARQDTPFNHDVFKPSLDFTYGEDFDVGISEVYTTSFDTTTVPDGWYRILVDTADNAGNEQRRFGSHVLIDNYDDVSSTPSNISWETGLEYGEVVQGDLTIEFSTEDDTGIYAAILWVNGGGYLIEPSTTSGESTISQEFGFVLNTEAFDDGTPLFMWVEVLDFDGHWTHTDDVLVFAGEPAASNPPQIDLITPSGDFIHDSRIEETITFEVQVEDDFGTYQPELKIIGPDNELKSFTFTALSASYYSLTLTVSNWVAGEYSWYVEVTDIGFVENTVTTDTHTITLLNDNVIADTEKPQLSVIQPSELTGLSGEVTFEVEATDNVGIQQVTIIVYEFSYTMDETVEGHYLYSVDTALIPDGEYSVSIIATDTSGNTESVELTVSFVNGNTNAPDLGIPFQVPWFLVFVTSVLVIKARKLKIN